MGKIIPTSDVIVLGYDGDRHELSSKIFAHIFRANQVFIDAVYDYGICRTGFATFILKDHRYFSNLRKEFLHRQSLKP